jgi:cytoskeletal protein CcmA (bactofilin family)
MTIFNRNTPDANASSNATNTRTTAMPETTPQNSAPRPQAYAQPISVPTPSSAGANMSTSVISKALKITGQLESTENIQIDGHVDGDVKGVNVKIGNGARVKGTVSGEEVEVSGTVDGKVEAKKVILTGTARMTGDVMHDDIKIESGAYIDGHCKPDFGKSKHATPPFKTVANSGSSTPSEKPALAAEAKH